MKKLLMMIGAAAVAAVMPNMAKADNPSILSNGSFESCTLRSSDTFPNADAGSRHVGLDGSRSVNNWSHSSSGAGLCASGDTPFLGGNNVSDGSIAVYLQNDGSSISQSVTVTDAGTYEVSFRYASRPNYLNGSLCVKIAGAGNSENFESVTYEGYGPSGTAIIVECLTDNRNRTAANVRAAFSKGSGNLGATGCVSFMFDKKGLIVIDKEECELDPDELMMLALDAGAEDFSEEEDSYEITTDPDDFPAVYDALTREGLEMASAEVTMIPQTYVNLTNPTDIKMINRILDLLDEDDDVQNVYHNWDEE